jgi:O-antigen ligase
MGLWKNAIVVWGILATVFFVFTYGKTSKQDRTQLTGLLTACVIMTGAIMLPGPYAFSMAVLVITLLSAPLLGVHFAALYIVLVSLVPMLAFPITGVPGIGVLVNLSTPLICGITAIAYRVINSHQFRRSGLRSLDIAIFIFLVGWVILPSRGETMTSYIRLATETFLTLGMGYSIFARARIRDPFFTATAFAYIGATVGLIAILESLRHWPQFVGVSALKSIPLIWHSNARNGHMRGLGPFYESISCSLFLTISFLAIWSLWISGYRRANLLALGAINLLGLAFTFSRTGLVSLAVGLAAFAAFRRRIADFIVVGILGIAGMIYWNFLNQGAAIGGGEYRKDLFKAVIRTISGKPWLGDNHAIEAGKLDDMIQGEGIVDMVNSYLQLALNGGVILVVMFLAIPAMAYQTYRSTRWSSTTAMHKLAAQTALAQLIALCAGLYFTSLIDKNLLYVMVLSGIVMNMSLQARQVPRNLDKLAD